MRDKAIGAELAAEFEDLVGVYEGTAPSGSPTVRSAVEYIVFLKIKHNLPLIASALRHATAVESVDQRVDNVA